jgi:hypothetical protein
MTLEYQYEQYLKDNPDSTYTFDEWKERVVRPILEAFIQELEKFKDDIKDWDVTLMDGLEDEPWEE